MSVDRDTLRALLRIGTDPAPDPRVTIGKAEQHSGHTQRRLVIEAGGVPVPGILLEPDTPGPHPAVLYCHAHGNAYEVGCEELILGRPALQGPYGPALARLGIASLAVDLAPFGARQGEGPESAISKAALWRGETMMGRMLSDLTAALTVLERHDRIDAARIATLGLSMGATHAYWMAALHPRIAACAHLCAFADIAPLIATGAHDLHGPYMTVPGLLAHGDMGDMGDVAALIAPRPQLVCSGALDPLTPAMALDPALDRVRAAYGAGDSPTVLISPETGHVETPAMRDAVLRFLRDALRPQTA